MKTDSKPLAHALQEYGFSENEAAIYLFLLKAIEASAFEVARETGIPRTTVYLTLEGMKRQGFVSQLRKNNVAYFTPESPSRLLALLKKKEEIVEEIMPELRAISSQHLDSPKAKLFVGIEGVKAGLEDILETLQEKKIKVIHATSQPVLLKFLPKYFPDWLNSREQLGVYTKLILPHDAHGYLDTNNLREVRYLPERFPFSCSVTIYADKLAFFSVREGEQYSVIIESKAITEMFLQFFQFTWEMLAPRSG